MSKCIVYDENITNICDKRKQLLNEMDKTYRRMRLLDCSSKLIKQTNFYYKNTILLSIDFKLLVTP